MSDRKDQISLRAAAAVVYCGGCERIFSCLAIIPAAARELRHAEPADRVTATCHIGQNAIRRAN